MKTKTFKSFLIVIFAAMLPQIASAYDFMVNGLCYSVNSDGSTVTVEAQSGIISLNYPDLEGELIIPSSVNHNGNDYIVTEIGFFAFAGCNKITSVSIPNTVTKINGGSNCAGAFEGCTSLTSITIPNSVTSIGFQAFSYCSSLTSVTIPSSVTYIGSDAFRSTPWYDNQPDGLIYAGKVAYKYKGEMPEGTSITFNDDCRGIAGGAFTGCGGLTSVSIGNSVTTIGESAFSWCGSLTLVTIGNSVTSIPYECFKYCSGLTSVTIGNSVTSIGGDAFSNCSGLTSVTIPNSVTSIGDYAFEGCSGLTSVTIPNSVTSIGSSAFYNCSSLTTIEIPNSVTTIGSRAFYNCNQLHQVYSLIETPTTVQMGNDVFLNVDKNGCFLLVPATSIDLYKSADQWKDFLLIVDLDFDVSNIIFFKDNTVRNLCITNWDFNGDGYFTKDEAEQVLDLGIVFRSKSITSFDELQYFTGLSSIASAFYNCNKLTSVTIPNSVTSIGESAFYYCSRLTTIEIPNSVTTIGSRAFYHCSRLTSVTIPTSVTSIAELAFYSCTGLTSVTIPNSVTYIGDGAFWGCSGLTSVTIPNSVTSIGECAFGYCTGLISVTIGNSVTTIGNNPFSGCSGLTSMVVESGNTKYDSRNNCNAIIETATNTLISGCKNTIIPNSVTSIGNSAFLGCTGLTSVTIPNSVTSIGEDAFAGCSGLTSVTIPNSVTSIGNEAFSDCSSLTSVTIPNSVTSIGSRAFKNCSGLTSVTIPNSVTSIGNEAFSDCSSLTSVTIPNSVTSIGVYAFQYCSGLTSLTIPNSVTTIGAKAFQYCSGLTSVTIPNSVTKISSGAFNNCTSLASVTLTGKGAWNYNSAYFLGLQEVVDQFKFVNIGIGITSLGNFGFTPDVVNCYAETPPTCSSGTFANYDGELHVPTTSIASYFMADYWQNFNNMVNDLGKVTLDKENANITLCDSLALSATVTPAGDEVIWSSTNPWVATVDENGVITATGTGECDIYATLASSHDAAYAICHITVNYPEITLALSDENLEMNIGDEQTLTATIVPENTGLNPTWTTSDENVATVVNGKVAAIGEGECDITATVLDKAATCHVTVTNNVTITLNVENAIIGASQMLTVYPYCSPDVPVELVVTSSDQSVALARVVNRTNAPALGLKSFPEKGMALAMMEELAAPSESKDPALASTKAIMIVGAQNGTATITVTTADGQAVPAVLELRVADVDGDRTITASDITCLYNYLLNSDESYIATSDVDGDGFITSADITVLYNLMLGN